MSETKRRRSLSIYKLNISMILIVLGVSVLILISGYHTVKGYINMRDSTDSFIKLQQSAYNMQIGSDYLTEQARYFAVTGEIQYLQNYFEEANVTKRRDNALDTIKSELSGSSAANYLTQSMNESVELMQTEYYSMRLTVEANDYNLSEFPQEVQDVTLKSEDKALSKTDMKTRALTLLMNKDYRDKKTAINDNMQLCLESMVGETEKEQIHTSTRLQELLLRQFVLIIILIIATMTFIALITALVIRPMKKAVIYIREDKPIPVFGSEEFQFLAETNNLMHESSKRRTGQLAFEASHDKLTGTFNRNGYDRLTKTLDMKNSALLLIDLDNFKNINDTYGHAVGDLVLVKVADTLMDNFRSSDYICRIGGDEFAIIAAETGPDAGNVLSRKIHHINNYLSLADDDVPSISLSVGIAFGKAGIDNERLFKQADSALYKVKQNGRKGCLVYKN